MNMRSSPHSVTERADPLEASGANADSRQCFSSLDLDDFSPRFSWGFADLLVKVPFRGINKVFNRENTRTKTSSNAGFSGPIWH